MQILFITILVKRSPGAQLDIMGIHCVSKYSDGNCRRSCAHKKLLTDRRMDETDNQGYNIIRLFGPMKKKMGNHRVLPRVLPDSTETNQQILKQ